MDPPRTLDAAEQRFAQFLVRNGYPADVRWLVADNVVVDKRRRCWIREDNERASAEANRRYLAGLERNLGIALRAVCCSGAMTFATVFIPVDDLDAQYQLMGRCLKISCPTETIQASIVKNPIRWFFLKLRYGRQSEMLEL